jgi:hypothetical protein
MQIFDKFIIKAFAENPSIVDDANFISYAATASAILSSKLLDSKSTLCVVSNSVSMHLYAMDLLISC